MADLVYIRTIAGEELLGLDIEGTAHAEMRKLDGVIVLGDVVQMAVNEQGVGFAPFIAYTDAHDRCEVKSAVVMVVCKPRPELANAYSRFLGKVFAPEKSLILP